MELEAHLKRASWLSGSHAKGVHYSLRDDSNDNLEMVDMGTQVKEMKARMMMCWKINDDDI
jgi:hypothetical protein